MKCYIHEKTREDAERVRDHFLSLGLIKNCGDITPKDRRLRDILVVEVNIDENEVKESFDHSEAFFKCKAYRYPHPISTNHIIRLIRYQYDK